MHLALRCRAHANSENDAEFVSDVRYALSALPRLETMVRMECADCGYGAWTRECGACERAQKEEMEVDSPTNSEDKGDAVWNDENVDDEIRLFETHLSESLTWQQLSALASAHPLSAQRSVAHACATSEKSAPIVCVIPAIGPAWPRAVRAYVPPSANVSAQSCSISDALLPVGTGQRRRGSLGRGGMRLAGEGDGSKRIARFEKEANVN